MIQEIADLERLKSCAQELKRKNFKPGFDHMDASAAILWLEVNGEELSRRILDGSYEAMPALGVHIAKKNGEYRQLARLTAIDTIVQNSILYVIEDLCEQSFSPSSFAYRKTQGLQQALCRFCELGFKYPYVVRINPVDCFDHMDHAVLETALHRVLHDKKTEDLIMRCVRMPILADGDFLHPAQGVLQGAPISGLLCNIYFDAIDKTLEEKRIPYIRYADDIAAFADTLSHAEEIHGMIADLFTGQLHLRENRGKTAINAPTRVKYLGYRFEADKNGLTVMEADHAPRTVYYNWHEERPENSRRRIDILSDGILCQKDFSLMFSSDTQETDLPAAATDIINIYSNVVFDSSFLKKAAEHGISINLFDRDNHLIGHFLPAGALKAPKVTAQQLLTYQDPKKRLLLAKSFLLASIHNTLLVIRYYQKQSPKDSLSLALERIGQTMRKIRQCEDYENLLLLEARAREIYYGCFDLFVGKTDFRFEKRSRRPPENEMNAMLCFGNVILYNLIAVEINKTALDIRVGYLHATNRRKESLNLDIAEIFKPLIVDRTIFSLINLRSIHHHDFRWEENRGCYLTEEGKRIFLRSFYEKLDSTLTIKNEKLSYHQLIKREIQSLIGYFRNGEKYKPFRQVR